MTTEIITPKKNAIMVNIAAIIPLNGEEPKNGSSCSRIIMLMTKYDTTKTITDDNNFGIAKNEIAININTAIDTV